MTERGVLVVENDARGAASPVGDGRGCPASPTASEPSGDDGCHRPGDRFRLTVRVPEGDPA